MIFILYPLSLYRLFLYPLFIMRVRNTWYHSTILSHPQFIIDSDVSISALLSLLQVWKILFFPIFVTLNANLIFVTLHVSAIFVKHVWVSQCVSERVRIEWVDESKSTWVNVETSESIINHGRDRCIQPWYLLFCTLSMRIAKSGVFGPFWTYFGHSTLNDRRPDMDNQTRLIARFSMVGPSQYNNFRAYPPPTRSL